MKKIYMGLISTGLLLSLTGCLKGESKEDYLGTWINKKEGIELTLLKANACKAYDIKHHEYATCNWDYKEKVVTLKGGKEQFSISLNKDKQVLVITIANGQKFYMHKEK